MTTLEPTSAPRERLSVVVIARNEAARLPTCLRSVAFADEIVVVDSGSSDGTPDLARSLGARVVETIDWPGFGPQKQRALAAATGDWVLSLDADEWVDDALSAAIQAVVAGRPPAAHGPAAADVWQVDRLSAFCGQWMRAGSWQPDRLPRLFRRGRARFSDDLVHERLLLIGGGDAASNAPMLPGLLLHNSITSLHDGIEKMNRYTTDRAADLRRRGRTGGLATALLHGGAAFLRSYVLRRGFVDGRRGFVLAVLDAQSSCARHLKLWLDGRPVPHELPPPGGPGSKR